MLLTIFEKNYFLLALGWGIINSLWQTGLLCLIYKACTVSKQSSAPFKYNLSLGLLGISFVWFLVAVINGFFELQQNGPASFSFNVQVTALYQKFYWLFQSVSCFYLVLLFLNSFNFLNRFKNIFSLRNINLIKAPVETRLFVKDKAAELGISKKVKVWISKNVEVPCVSGYLKPIILLPFSSVNNLSTFQVEAVILHELAHIRRNDYLVNIFQSVIELVLFFNPFALFLGKEVRKEREHCCDNWVLNFEYSKKDYAKALMILETSRQQPVQLALAATGNEKLLLSRVKRLFTINTLITGMDNHQKIRLAIISVIAFFLLIFLSPALKSPSNEQYGSTTWIPKVILNSPKAVAVVLPEEHNASEVENKIKTVVNEPTVQEFSIKKSPVKLKAPKKAQQHEVEYAEALINEELLLSNEEKELQNQAIAITAAGKALSETKEYLIQIEEEVSGSKGKKSYVLEYKNIDGKTEVKPLLIVNKTKILSSIKSKKSIKKSAVKRKITS